MSKPPKSIAGKVLATGHATDEEAKALAGAVLGDDGLTPAKSTKTKADLERILARIDGQEGQTERAEMIRQHLANWTED